MMNYETFNKELEESDRISDGDSELIQLRKQLRDYSESTQDRSDFHQKASWTRLQSRLDKKTASRGFSSFLAPIALPGLMGIILAIWLIPGTTDTIGKVDAPNIEISTRQPNIYVTPFHSKSVQADVIWAEGYQYIPASYTVTR
jgi:hypothetical protein